MKTFAVLIGCFIVAVAIVGLVAPNTLVTVGRHVVTPPGLYLVAALRIGIGIVLIGVARASRSPKTLRVVGAIVLIAGLVTPFFGADRTDAVLNGVAERPWLVRVGAVLALAGGTFIVYVVRTGRRTV